MDMKPKSSDEEMKVKHGIQELDAMGRMVVTWKESHYRLAQEEGGGGFDFLVDDFMEEIETHIYPFVRRLQVTSHVDEGQMKDFLDFCFQQVRDLQELLKEG